MLILKSRFDRMLKVSMGQFQPEAVAFVFRATVLFLFWKILYVQLLLPAGEPDGWLVRKLGESTVWSLNMVHGEELYQVRHGKASDLGSDREIVPQSVIYRSGERSDLGIGAPCNGLELMVLSAGFILCFSAAWRKKVGYVLFSIAIVFAVNIVRCSLLTVIRLDHSQYFDFTHKYLFNLVGYGCVFLVWMHFLRHPAPSDDGDVVFPKDRTVGRWKNSIG